MTPLIPLTRDLVLIGGGHAHALVLRMFGMTPLAGVRITVINPGPTAPYTGMLPGFVAGHYERDDLDIDLVKLCRFAGARLIIGKATGLDRKAKAIQIDGRPDFAYDVASFDIGITSEMPALDGFSEHAIAAKPLNRFADQWTRFLDRVERKECPPDAAVIGGGIGGAELALAINHRLKALGHVPNVSLIEAKSALTGVSETARRRLETTLKTESMNLLLEAQIDQIGAEAVTLRDLEISSHFTVGAAGARPHEWLSKTDLPLTDGYITVGETLTSTDDPDIFAAGDCAHLAHAPRPKAGVFAVRAAPVLFHNLRARLGNGQPKAFKPQKTYLKLISLGKKSAIAEKGGLSFTADMMWRWKDHIDQKFMDQFRQLPKMAPPEVTGETALGVADIVADKPLCGGCGAKVGPGVLHDALCEQPKSARKDVLLSAGDDAAILKIGGRRQVITVDHLRAFDSDPWRMARIATVHAMGDVLAMGAEPQSLLVSLILPRMSAPLQRCTMSEIMEAVQSVAQSSGAEVVGGHTSIGAEMTIGLTVTGLLPKGTDGITTSGAKAGDALILTKPIGSGTLLAAEMAGDAKGADIEALLHHMQMPLDAAAKLLAGAHAMTDVTGFGLGGHLHAICTASNVGADIRLEDIPVFDGAQHLNRIGHRSSIYQDNAEIASYFTGLRDEIGELLFDPQTAGGLLAAVDADQAVQLLADLQAAGYSAAIIGHVNDQTGRITCV